jgi:hypothetical protein
MKLLNRALFWMLLPFGFALAQDIPAPSKLINIPTVATMPRASFLTELRFAANGGVLAGVDIGLADRISLGLSYGGSGIIGNDSIFWNPQPGVSAKYRLIDEQIFVPGVSVGFSSQGYGNAIDGYYQIPAHGFYLVGSKNWMLLGHTSIHAGINYSLEQPSEKRYPSFFLGAAMELNPLFSMMLEYDAALNYELTEEARDFIISKGYGLLNAGFRVGITENIFVELDLTNLIWDNKKVYAFNRELKIIFFDEF